MNILKCVIKVKFFVLLQVVQNFLDLMRVNFRTVGAESWIRRAVLSCKINATPIFRLTLLSRIMVFGTFKIKTILKIEYLFLIIINQLKNYKKTLKIAEKCIKSTIKGQHKIMSMTGVPFSNHMCRITTFFQFFRQKCIFLRDSRSLTSKDNIMLLPVLI